MHLPTKPFSPTIFKASLSASMEELPWAMFAKGPAWTKTGVPQRKFTFQSMSDLCKHLSWQSAILMMKSVSAKYVFYLTLIYFSSVISDIGYSPLEKLKQQMLVSHLQCLHKIRANSIFHQNCESATYALFNKTSNKNVILYLVIKYLLGIHVTVTGDS